MADEEYLKRVGKRLCEKARAVLDMKPGVPLSGTVATERMLENIWIKLSGLRDAVEEAESVFADGESDSNSLCGAQYQNERMRKVND